MSCYDDHLENFHILQCIYHKLLIFDNKQIVKTHKLLGYYSYKNS